jgi:hypothetical protein
MHDDLIRDFPDGQCVQSRIAASKKGGPQAAFSVVRLQSYWMTISTPAVLRLAHVVAGRHQELALALADDRDRLGRHAVADESVLEVVADHAAGRPTHGR